MQLESIYDAARQAPASYITLCWTQAAGLSLICIGYGGRVWRLWGNDEQKLKPARF